ncbi:MAG: Gfo/Idh/MocA family oxidoreductase [Sedimentisphaerales bacterium]|nr:Gfo/Idh/MocA family oxidoreductase [Sedimentisphaerales bacterium]
MAHREPQSINRRDFLAATGVTAFGFTVMSAKTARTYAANSKIKFGLIGCGGRGVWIANLFNQHGGFEVFACSDYFQERIDGCGQKFNIPQERRFPNLGGYKGLLACGVEAVAVESPPYFHPIQAAAAVTAGKHTYVAKPIAVDVPGCKTIHESGKKATEKKLAFLIDFQTRADPFYIEALKRVHEGALGDFAFGESTYHAGIPWGGHMEALKNDPNNPETQLRAWGMSIELSGDIITEQNIHTLDVMNWIMREPPLYATGSGARTVRPVGACYDHFTCLYQYANDVGITFSSRQFEGHGTQPEGIRNRMFGNKGVLETEYGGQVLIRGENFYRGGKSPGIYQDGAIANIAAFHKNITEGNYANDTVQPSVQSNQITILGRTAAYQKRRVTWNELLRDTTRMEPDFTGLKA